MTEEIDRSYRRASRAAAVGTACMCLLFLLMLLNALVLLYVAVGTDTLRVLPDGQVLVMLASNLVPALQVLPLAGFLRHFADGSPFEPAQSARLAAAGALLLLQQVLSGMYAPLDPTLVSAEPVPLLVTDAPGVEVDDITMVVFLLCLALVVRYGGALKEDSDSIA